MSTARYEQLKSKMKKPIGLNIRKQRVNKIGRVTIELEAKRNRKSAYAVKDNVSWKQFHSNPLYMESELKKKPAEWSAIKWNLPDYFEINS